ncbi:MAG: helix-turn-helix transcriptional regulator [Proteobacteria bacterium]|nr:helix-turn-helix transcriptional regulator [Pseudomonadota bacterium]
MLDFYITNIDILEKFRIYFKQKAHDLIERHKLNPIKLPNFDRAQNSYKKENYRIDKEQLLKAIALDEYNLNNQILPKREVECLAYLSLGKSSKETAKIMKISHRTVEKHLEIVKDKLGCNTKNQLKEIFIDSELKELFE